MKNHPNYLRIKILADLKTLARQYWYIRDEIHDVVNLEIGLDENPSDEDMTLLQIKNGCQNISDRALICDIILEKMKKKITRYKESIEKYLKEQEE